MHNIRRPYTRGYGFGLFNLDDVLVTVEMVVAFVFAAAMEKPTFLCVALPRLCVYVCVFVCISRTFLGSSFVKEKNADQNSSRSDM
jgi:hypothetical protein